MQQREVYEGILLTCPSIAKWHPKLGLNVPFVRLKILGTVLKQFALCFWLTITKTHSAQI